MNEISVEKTQFNLESYLNDKEIKVTKNLLNNVILPTVRETLGIKKKKSKKTKSINFIIEDMDKIGGEGAYDVINKRLAFPSKYITQGTLYHELVHYTMDKEGLFFNQKNIESKFYQIDLLLDETIAELATDLHFTINKKQIHKVETYRETITGVMKEFKEINGIQNNKTIEEEMEFFRNEELGVYFSEKFENDIVKIKESGESEEKKREVFREYAKKLPEFIFQQSNEDISNYLSINRIFAKQTAMKNVQRLKDRGISPKDLFGS